MAANIKRTVTRIEEGEITIPRAELLELIRVKYNNIVIPEDCRISMSCPDCSGKEDDQDVEVKWVLKETTPCR